MKTFKFIGILAFLLWLPVEFSEAQQGNETRLPIIWNVPETHKNLISRGDFIDKIRHSFLTTPKNQVGSFYLSGPTGIGKTYIAKTYANHYKDNYDIIYFFNSETNNVAQLKKFNFEINQLQKKLTFKDLEFIDDNDPEKITYYTKEFLRTTKLKWLIIFDNVCVDDGTLKFIPEHTLSPAAHVILTSQAHRAEQNSIAVPLPNVDASFHFLSNELDNRRDKKENILQLASSLKNYPLALSQASAYLRKNTVISIEEYLKILKIEQQQNPLQVAKMAVLASVVNIEKINPKSKQLLNLISCMHSKNIPGSLLKNWFLNQQNNSYHDFTQSIALATSYSLITPTQQNSEFFDTHDFIQETIYNTLSTFEKVELNKSLISAIRSEFMKGSKDIINPIFSEVIDHAKAAYDRGINEKNISKEFLSLLLDILEHNNTYKRDFASNYAYIMRILPIFESAQVKDREVKSRFFITAARFFWRMGKMEECANYLAKAQSITFPADVEEYNRLKIYQSDLEIETGNLKVAKKHLIELEKHSKQWGYSKKTESAAHYYLMVLHNMSLTDYFNLQGDFEKALFYINFGIEKATYYYKTKTGVEPPLSVMAPLYNTRNFSLIMKNDPNLSPNNLAELTRQMEKTFNSNDHRFVSLARILHAMTIMNERPEEAAREIQFSLANLNKWFQGDKVNKEQVLGYILLGKLYTKLNELNKSIDHLTNALNISKVIFRDLRNVYVHEAMDGLVTAYLKKDAIFDAQNIYNMHKEIFSENDPKTKGIYDKILHHYHEREQS